MKIKMNYSVFSAGKLLESGKIYDVGLIDGGQLVGMGAAKKVGKK